MYIHYKLFANAKITHLKYSFRLVCRYISLCKLRIWSPLKASEAVAFFNLKYVSQGCYRNIQNYGKDECYGKLEAMAHPNPEIFFYNAICFSQ